ncbi:hypothetical protein IW262DRAFT_511930 [Armillaria fumosa]|nr:hypothetical protein IW262DRAFT_511930 [Armillaria fumosa]
MSLPSLFLVDSLYGSQHGLSSLSCDSASSSGSASVPITPTDEVASFGFLSHQKQNGDNPGRHTYCIDILPDDTTDRHSSTITDNARRICDEPRPIRAIDPTLAFISRSPIAANSNFTILVDGVVVLSEMTSLTLRDTPPVEAAPGTDGLLYTTPLVPGYWKTIYKSSYPTKHTIFQDIVETPHASGALYSASFKFNYPTGYSASEPLLLSDPQFGFSFDNLPADFGTNDSTEMIVYGKPESHVYDFLRRRCLGLLSLPPFRPKLSREDRTQPL